MREYSGFTLVELLIVIAIIAITATFTAPSLMHWRDTAKLRGVVNTLVADLHKAKLAAIKDNARNAILFDSNGYQIFRDNGSGSGHRLNWARDPDETLIKARRFGEYTSGIYIDLNATTFRNNRTGFNGRGHPRITGRVFVVNSSGDRRSVIVNRVGRIRVEIL